VVDFFTAGSLGTSTPGARAFPPLSMPRRGRYVNAQGPTRRCRRTRAPPAPRSCDNLAQPAGAEPGGDVKDVLAGSERMSAPLRVLVVGCGNMGSSHARAYHSTRGSTWSASLTTRQEPGRRWRPLLAASRRSTTTAARSPPRARTAWPSAPTRHARRPDAAGVRRRLPRVRREARGDQRNGGRIGRGRGRAGRAQARRRLHPPAPPVVAEVHRAGPVARHAARDAD